jgi:acyl-CoA thioester hydrolase
VTYPHRLRVRYAETDQMGVVHHANYILYLEEARTVYMASLGCSYAALERSGVGLAVRKLRIHHRASALYEEELIVTTRIARVRGASVLFGYEVHRATDDVHLASAETELACIDLASDGRPPRPLPDELRTLLSAET